MCGICGVVDWTGADDADAIVRRMTPTMVHRGPDDEGYLSAGPLSFDMRRLSIIDLEGGHQPIFNAEGTVGAVLNGEIYNFQPLRKQLEDRGHSFRTRADSEVVAHAYEEWGPESVERLEGMFALAIFDKRPQRGPDDGGTLFIARDRLGIKPLYYYAENVQSPKSKVQSLSGEPGPWTLDIGHWTRFLFASEVRTLLASGVVPRRLSQPAVESYLLFGSVSEPMTMVEGVLSLPPGHRMTIRLDSPGTSVKPERYWNVSQGRVLARGSATNGEQPAPRRNSPANGDSDRTTVAREVRQLLERSVRKHLIADVPVGVFLSSGIDSTSLAALASREVAGVHTFTVAFPEKEFSEATIARRTAERLGTTHQEVMLSGTEMLARLNEAVSALDQPTLDGINTYFVSWSARQAGLKVALSGLGGDEVFGGYATFWRTAQYQRMVRAGDRVPAGLRSAVSTVAAAAESAGGRFVRGDVARKIAALWSSPRAFPDPFYFGRALFTPPQVSGLMQTTKTNGHQPLWWDWLSESAAQARKLDPFAAVSCMEAQSYLVNTLLRDTDSMSMAHSLEVRVPFLDHLLVEFVMQLPREVKVRRGRPKALLIAALSDLLPAEVVNPRKRGFTFPWAAWLRGPLKKTIDEGLSQLSPALRESLNSESVRGIWQSHLEGKTSWSRPWSLYVLNEWTKRHLD